MSKYALPHFQDLSIQLCFSGFLLLVGFLPGVLITYKVQAVFLRNFDELPDCGALHTRMWYSILHNHRFENLKSIKISTL
jgi:hypothetical protein